MHHHTTHWSLSASLHVGTVHDCQECGVLELPAAAQRHVPAAAPQRATA
jgi:hypothetical protein